VLKETKEEEDVRDQHRIRADVHEPLREDGVLLDELGEVVQPAREAHGHEDEPQRMRQSGKPSE